jgi:hypothetical protein
MKINGAIIIASKIDEYIKTRESYLYEKQKFFYCV